MQTSNSDQRIRPNNPLWCFLAEYPLSEFTSDLNGGEKLRAGLLFQTVSELGIPPEYVEKIEMMLIGFAREALIHFKQGTLELPGRIRIFCQEKMIDEANSIKTTNAYNSEQELERARYIHHPGSKTNGGWGYFLIETGGNVSAGSSASSWNSVDLYLYKEGE
jgi:hypothetical protein